MILFIYMEHCTKLFHSFEREREREMTGASNGNVKNSINDGELMKIPKVKFTKLFINGDFVDSISG